MNVLTTDSTLSRLSDWTGALNEEICTDVVYMDYAEAFDI